MVDIAKLMKAYISMIVKKRYSTSRSVSSHGSQGSSRWKQNQFCCALNRTYCCLASEWPDDTDHICWQANQEPEFPRKISSNIVLGREGKISWNSHILELLACSKLSKALLSSVDVTNALRLDPLQHKQYQVPYNIKPDLYWPEIADKSQEDFFFFLSFQNSENKGIFTHSALIYWPVYM